MKKMFSSLAIVFFAASIGSESSASIEPKTFKLSVETVFLHYVDGKYSDAEGDETPPAYQGDVNYNSFDFGVGQPQVGIGIGIAVYRNLMLGLKLTLGYGTQETQYENNEETDTEWAFRLGMLPYAEYIFLDGLVRPFVTVITGVDGTRGEAGETLVSRWAFFIGAGGGAHIFFHESFSLNFSLIPALGIGKGKNEVERREWEYENVYFDLNIAIGISGWI